jgi:hypothetical protein
MAIYRGTGGASDSTDDSTISAVTTQAGIATTKASEAASSATDANTSATNAAASATAASGHASTSSDNATASSGSATDAAGFATAASNSATAASNSATAAANSASTANSTEVQAVAAKTTEITGVYNDIANVNTVAGNITDVNTVATNSSNITAVAADASDIGTVAGSISNVNTVGDNIASVNTVASNNTNINTVAADASDIGTVAGISGNVTTVAGISSDVTTVVGLESKMDTVIADASDIGTVAGNIGDVSTVAGISSDVDTVAGISSDVTSVADNMTAVQNATTSATNAATSAASASDSASAAATSAGTASSSASDASTSETNAANSATSASNSATAASGSASAASGSESASSGSASAAASSASAASTSASNASNSETNAASSATAASGSASAAATSETNATASESNANASKNAAATSATNAATSETNAAASYDSFDDRYLGVKSSAPATDNDGGALLTGALYFNSTNNTMNVFTGSAWAPVANNNIINPNVALTQDLATNGNDIKFGDNDKATFGAGDDLQIYHNGSDSYVDDAGVGDLVLRGNNQVLIKDKATNDTMVNCRSGQFVKLYYNNAEKLATTSTGIDVTGTATMDGLTVDGNVESLGTFILNNGTDKWQNLFSTNDLIIRNNHNTSWYNRLRISYDGDISFYEDTGTTPKLVWDASAESLSLSSNSAYVVTNSGKAINGLDIAGAEGSLGSYGGAISFGTGRTGRSAIAAVQGHATDGDANGLAFFTHGSSGSTGDSAKRMEISNIGDISFYEDTGTTAKLFWDASAESLRVPISLYDNSINAFPSQGYAAVYSTGAGGSAPFNEAGHLVLQARSSGALRDILFATGNGAAERMRITNAGKVGIGTATIGGSSTTKLHLMSATTSSPTVANDADELIIEGAGSSGMTFLSTSSSNIRFGDAADSSVGQIRYTHSDNSLMFGANNAERMRIDSSGNLLVGKTAASSATVGFQAGQDGFIAATRASAQPLVLNRTTNDGTIADFRKDGTAVGSIGTRIGDLLIGTGDTGLQFVDEYNEIIPRHTNGNNIDATIQLGASSSRFTNLYLSGASYIPDVRSTGTQYFTHTTDVRFRTVFGTERARIDSSGNLLVGTTDSSVYNNSANSSVDNGINLMADGKFYAAKSGATVAILNRTSSDGGILEFNRSGTTVGSIGARASYLNVGSGDTGLLFNSGQDRIQPESTTGGARDAAIDIGGSITRFKDLYLSNKAYANYIGGVDDTNTYIRFAGGDQIRFYNGGNERARIDASGNLLVGTTSTLRNNKFHASSGNFVGGFNVTNGTGEAVAFFSNGTVVGTVSVTGSATTYNTSSDQRLKENIADADDAGSKIDAIQVRKYDWKADGSHQDYGMIAQELQAVAPEAVSGDADSEEMMGVDYSKLVPMLIKEIQSLRNRVAQLEE